MCHCLCQLFQVILADIIEQMHELWTDGIETYDAHAQSTFRMRALVHLHVADGRGMSEATLQQGPGALLTRSVVTLDACITGAVLESSSQIIERACSKTTTCFMRRTDSLACAHAYRCY